MNGTSIAGCDIVIIENNEGFTLIFIIFKRVLLDSRVKCAQIQGFRFRIH